MIGTGGVMLNWISYGPQDLYLTSDFNWASKRKHEPQENFFTIPENYTNHDLCAICHENMQNIATLLVCPDCKNCLHKDCMHNWLSSEHTTCVYCRSDVWTSYRKTICKN